MTTMNMNKKIAEEVLAKVGGKDNITKCFHCVTRLRLELKDKSLIDKKAIEEIDGVIALKIQGEQYQVVIGQNVGKVYKEFCEIADIVTEESIEESLNVKQKITLKRVGNAIVQSVVNSVIPTLPILVGAGMFKVIALLILQFKLLDATSSTYLVLNNIGECGFYFLPIFVGMSAAKHFKTSVPIATMICSFLLFPAFSNSLTDGTITNVFGLPITPVTYSSTVLPAIMIVWIMSYVHKLFEKYIPNVVATILVPTLTLLITVPIAICVLGPLGSIAGTYLADGLMYIYNTFGFVGMAIMGALRPLLIFTGMHTALLPFAIQTLTENGYETFFTVTGMGYVFASAAACLAVAIKSKNINTKSSAFTCASTAFIGGVTEPSLYGVLMKLKKPLIAVMIANALASAYFGITHTYVYAMAGSTGMFGIPAMIGPNSANLINGVIGLVIAMVVAFALTWIIGFKEEE